MRASSWMVFLVAMIAGCGGRSRLPLPAPPTTLVVTDEAAFVAPPTASSGLRAPTLPTVEEARLSNGMRVMVVRATELPLVSLVYASRAATSQDQGVVRGIDVLLEWVVGRLVPSPDLEVLSSGVTITMNGARPDLGRLIDEIAGIARMEAIPEEVVRAERRMLADEIVDASRSYYVRIHAVHERQLIYGPSDTRSEPWYGALDRFRQLNAGDVLARHHELFASDASALVVVGDVELADVVAHVEAAFGDWVAPARPHSALPPAGFPTPDRRLHVFPSSGPATIGLRERAPHSRHPDRPAFEVAAALLGGMFGARINRVLREERGHTYGVNGSIDDYRDYAVLRIDLAVPTTHTRSTVFEIIHEMERVQDASRLEEHEMVAARATAIGRYRRRLETRRAIAATLALLYLRGDTLEAWAARIASIADVSAEDVARVARDWLRPNAAPMLVSCEWMQMLDLQNFIPGGTEMVLDH